MKKIILMLTFTIMSAVAATAQNSTKFTLKKHETMKSETLDIQPSVTSSEKDFNFLEGKWKVHNKKLKSRLNNSTEWDEFESELHLRKTLNGLGNVENYYATFDGNPFEGMAVRLYNPKTRLWKIYWMDSNNGTMDENPVTGSFEKGIGKFYTDDIFNDKKIRVIYQWDATNPEHPIWSQAFSTDNGKTWEWNWVMTLSKI
ncbi:hypothetical protein [Flavobacterium wongokense]|uniref:hypothetical protein n=1 Tax=Flavobacterium wongokense TaxID=2910674 RepID=UPI001F180D7C|nr:hypothetical protein [Flavobacterium sp. WG47]MCF6132545.1 hypothetical protein [Flavobacterium sp. WG47]